ncbi:MAG: glycosyltransferase family 4 protein [Myxococcota bacterium]|nr:glycosyltransferase family 4 protein [Myxococcota bacterium]
MRVLHLVDRLSTRGGAPCILLDMVERQASRHRVVVACGGQEQGLKLPAGVEVARVKGLGSRMETTGGLSGLQSLLSEADLVHVHTVMNPIALSMAVDTGRCLVSVQDHRGFCPGAGKVTRSNVVCEQAMSHQACGDCFEDSAYAARMLELTCSRRDAIQGATLHVLSRYMQRELEAVGLLGAEVLPPWVAAADEPSLGGDIVFMGGRLVPHKGVLLGVQAWRESGIDAPLHVAGEGPMADQMEGATLLGWLPRKALLAELRRAGVLLFPGRWQEPFGLLAIEALAQGTPVIAMESGGLEEFSDGGCVLSGLGDVEAMASNLREVWKEPLRMRELGFRGWELVRERFSPDSLGERLDRLYERVAEG